MKKSIFYLIMFAASMIILVVALTDLIIKCGIANSDWADTKIWGNINGNIMDVCLFLVGGYGALMFLKKGLDPDNFKKENTEPLETKLQIAYLKTIDNITNASELLIESTNPEQINLISQFLVNLYQTKDAIELHAKNNNISLTDDTTTS